jgi:hypothetical protein
MPPPALRAVEPALSPPPPLLEPMAMLPAVAIMQPPPTDAASLRARYGAPDFIRRESESELWRYDGADCAVFFFLYREGDVLKLRYSETMPRGMGVAADPVCVESLNAHAGAS